MKRRGSRNPDIKFVGRLGTLRLGETVLPITHMEFTGGFLQVRATGYGPLSADGGQATIYDTSGRLIISNPPGSWAGFDDVAPGCQVEVCIPVRIRDEHANPLAAPS